ncbi:LacI family DNA-binding transcriptional regulator [Mesorhizobium huakuii]|uniref:LacI family DNA-binding transcriptional regulator n=1 Tax=Mesorhizobium huakuii TaxID=28104 RepID=A0A7G6SY04_9HYPH|nr:LacI family DNA-binding transcriptional regulator [Mesorhizobium huakuii]QND59386.1 LacI family DNA-binding transcriptional regulator [Mesorhizobium huakuii]
MDQGKRPTIKDVAAEANVSVATVNRVLSGSGAVRQGMRERVRLAAEQIGFYGMGALRSRVAAARPRCRFGFLLHQPGRAFYRNIAEALRAVAPTMPDCEIELRTEFLDDLSPQNVASRMLALGTECDAVGVVAAVHPLVTQAVDTLHARNVPVFALISQISATGHVRYIGLDNWKVGRTAAWVFEHVCRAPGKLGILVGNHRYRCQEMNESGFRSYFREHAPGFTLLEPLLTFESSAIAQEMTEKLLNENPDLSGLYVAGGGITGAIAALRSTGRAGSLVVVGYELMESTRPALLDGTLTFVISHPLARIAQETLAGMIRAVSAPNESGSFTNILPFEIYTRENI